VARGWESKSVEAQQAEASEKSSQRPAPMGAEEAARWREQESLRLSRQRVLQQLEASQNPRHRKLLEDTLADLEAKLRK
jgi:DNA-binding PadR family transcriptional regulator